MASLRFVMKFGQVTYFGEKQKYLVSILWSGHHCCDSKGIDSLNNKSNWRDKCILNFHYIMAYSSCKNNDVKSFCLHKICS